MNNKERALEIYNKHIALATIDGRLFRKTVMDEMMAEFVISLASAATGYNNCKKAAPVEGLGRNPISKNVRKMPVDALNPLDTSDLPDEECYTVVEVIDHFGDNVVGKTESFAMQGDASELFDMKVKYWPFSDWCLISGLGPNSGEQYKLEPGESEIKRHKLERSGVAKETTAV